MSKSPTQIIKEYFNFSKRDRNAVISMSVIILVAITGNIIVNNISLRAEVDHSEFERALETLKTESLIDTNRFKLFEFNPNTITKKELDSLRIPIMIKKNLLGYRSAGGEFYNPSDIRKIYGMNDSIYSIIKNLIKICPESSKPFEKEFKNSQKVQTKKNLVNSDTSTLLIELNTADSLKLIILKGIGPVFASRMIKYRNLLGGFYSDEQLLEVYNFPEETFFNIRKYLTVDTLKIKKIRVNFTDYIELIRHPYLTKEEVEKILSYREKNGPFKSISQILSCELIDSLKFNKIKPYLSCR